MEFKDTDTIVGANISKGSLSMQPCATETATDCRSCAVNNFNHHSFFFFLFFFYASGIGYFTGMRAPA